MLSVGDRAQYTYANGSIDRDLIVRRSARDRWCDGWDKNGVGCEAEINRGELHAANRYGLAHFCVNCVEPWTPKR